MKVWIRRLFILIIMIIFLVAFSGSYSALSIDNLSTVVAIAIDTSDTNQLRMSFQFTMPLLFQNLAQQNNLLQLFIVLIVLQLAMALT